MVALGSAAQDKGLQVGQRVGIGWTARSCGHCDACISGNQINCEQGAVPTIMNRGGFAEKLRADWQWEIRRDSERGYCCHGFDRDCCPLGCGDLP